MRVVSAIGVVCLAFVAARPAHAQTPQFGPELSWASNSFGVGVGARAELSLAKLIPSVKGLSAVGSFDYFFPGTGLTYWELNVDGAYHFQIPNVKLDTYAGAGIDIGHFSVTDCSLCSGTYTGLNLMAGTNFPVMGKITPFAELRLELRTASAFVITGGVLF